MDNIDRRTLLKGSVAAAGLLGVGGLAACNKSGSGVAVTPRSIRQAEAKRRSPNQKVVEAHLVAQPIAVNLGGLTVQTWGYGDALPG